MTAVSGILRPGLESCVLPFPATIESVTALTPRERLFRLRPEHPLVFRPSQFVMLTLLGVGEAPISICSDPAPSGTFELCVRRVGTVTTALHAATIDPAPLLDPMRPARCAAINSSPQLTGTTKSKPAN